MSFKDYKEVGQKYGIGGDWMDLKEGDNKIRIVSEFKDYGSHFMGKGIPSLVCIGKEDCQACKKEDNPKVQFLGWVLDRADGEVKLLRAGYQIFSLLGQLAESEEYGFDVIPKYDITINKTGEGLQTKYNVLPGREEKDLTNEESEKVMEKIKDPDEIIEAMKAKVLPEAPDEEEIPGETL